MELNFEGLEMQKWNVPMDRARIVDEKNGVVFLVIMFTTWVMVKHGKTYNYIWYIIQNVYSLHKTHTEELIIFIFLVFKL